MILNLLVLALVALCGYLWSAKGFFSSFLHLVCVIIAGAVAFGVWEPVSIMVLNASPSRGMLASIGGNAWTIGLLIPFAVALVLLRVVSDKIVRANVTQNTIVDYVGGGVCGVLTGIISIGILVIGLGNLRFTDTTMGMGYRPIWHSSQRATQGGSLVYEGGLWVPADKLTGMLYTHLSLAAFSSPEPLAKWQPMPHIAGPASKLTYNEGAARNTAKPRDVTFRGTYIVGQEDGSSPIGELLADSWGEGQKYVDMFGEPVSRGTLFGVKFELGSEAKESTGQHMVSPGQLRLICEPLDASGKPTGEPSTTIFPIALISQGDSSAADSFGRWRFDAEGVHVSSVGGSSSSIMAAEFIVPTNARPIAMYVKGTRIRLDSTEEAPSKFATVGMRDAAVRSGTIVKTVKMENLDRSNAVEVSERDVGSRGEGVISVTTRLGMREAFQVSQRRQLVLGEKNRIVSGVGTWTPEEVSKGRDISQALKVDRFAVPPGTLMVQVDVSSSTVASLLGTVGRNAAETDAFYLVDTQGTPYQAVGYIYKDRNRYDIRYLPGQPLTGSGDIEAPGLSSVRDDQELKLLFLVSQGVELQSFVIGQAVVLDLEKPRPLNDRVD